jgi:hypothetical protein
MTLQENSKEVRKTKIIDAFAPFHKKRIKIISGDLFSVIVDRANSL